MIERFKGAIGYVILTKEFYTLSINHSSLEYLINSNESINIDSINTIIVYDESPQKDSFSKLYADLIENTYLKFKFNVVERSYLEVLLNEQGLSQSGLVS